MKGWPTRAADMARIAFDRMPSDTRRALYNGDIDLDDALTDELGTTARNRLMHLVEAWGDENAIV